MIVDKVDAELVIGGLSALDREELKEILSPDQVAFNEPGIPEGSLAEPAAIAAIIVLTPITIAALGLYFGRKIRLHTFDESVEITRPDGTKLKHRLQVRAKSAEEANTQVLAQLQQFLDG
jgi:hypothetical protein